jgi:hypothetical protein
VERNAFLIALGMLLLNPVVSAFVTRRHHGWREASVTVAGVILLLVGWFWSAVGRAIPTAFVERIEQLSSNVNAWLLLVIVLWMYSVAVQLIERRHVHSQIGSLQGDFDHFVRPRQLTLAQGKSISDYLLQRPAQTVAVRFSVHDSEATNYATEIYEALRTGGWKVNRQGLSAAEFAKQSMISEGFGIFRELDATNSSPEAERQCPLRCWN